MPTLQGSDKSGEGLEPTATPACESVLNHSKLYRPVSEIQPHVCSSPLTTADQPLVWFFSLTQQILSYRQELTTLNRAGQR